MLSLLSTPEFLQVFLALETCSRIYANIRIGLREAEPQYHTRSCVSKRCYRKPAYHTTCSRGRSFQTSHGADC